MTQRITGVYSAAATPIEADGSPCFDLFVAHCHGLLAEGCHGIALLGTPGEADGEMAAWVDGQLYLHLKGFRWRTSADVKPKRITCGMYIHQSERANVLYYDDLAVSTGYVGPLE